MYQNIALPIDLAHADQLNKAIKTGTDLAKHYNATLTFVGVTGPAPSSVANSPEEYADKLQQFAADQAAEVNIEIQSKAVVSKDRAVDLDKTLDNTFHDMGVDLVVMASHIPGLKDYVFHSNAGYLASHSDLSVMVVR